MNEFTEQTIEFGEHFQLTSDLFQGEETYIDLVPVMTHLLYEYMTRVNTRDDDDSWDWEEWENLQPFTQQTLKSLFTVFLNTAKLTVNRLELKDITVLNLNEVTPEGIATAIEDAL